MNPEDNLILHIALPTPLRQQFDYLAPQGVDLGSLQPGLRVRVPFQSRKLVGILLGTSQKTAIAYHKLKRAEAILDKSPLLSDDIYKLCHWAAEYYHHSLGEVLSLALPTLLRQGKLPKAAIAQPHEDNPFALGIRTNPIKLNLNGEQEDAYQAVCKSYGQFQVFLLDGVTGSGKTEVYLHCIENCLHAGQQVLVLVPEISLTPQTVARFKARFKEPIVVLHSSLSSTERWRAWSAAKKGEAKIIIGTRSAVFTPCANLGLIIVDEEHDTSFKQQDRLRYHARDLAVMRANLSNHPILLGSATPSLESLLNVQRGRYNYLRLSKRAGNASLPTYQLIDLRQSSHKVHLSEDLLLAMDATLKAGNQIMLFINRRGFAPVLYCSHCNFIVNCSRCAARMVYHREPLMLQCHHCDSKRKIPSTCLQCHEPALQPIGLGTQRLEQQLKKHFADVPIIRIDRDSTRAKGSIEKLLAVMHQPQPAIVLGTQMLGKGHHFPRITLVGILDADAGLLSVDFRAAEQMGQLLLQVAGRAGREDFPGKVLIQTRNPTHPLLQTLLQEGYSVFAQKLLSERERSELPPYTYFALLRAEAHAEETARTFLQKIKSTLSNEKVEVMGPVPAVLAKRKGFYCQHLLIRSSKRSTLQDYLKLILERITQLPHQRVRWALDVDPTDVI